jgi:hypothetical protein
MDILSNGKYDKSILSLMATDVTAATCIQLGPILCWRDTQIAKKSLQKLSIKLDGAKQLIPSKIL